MRIRLLVDSAEYWEHLLQDIPQARERVFVQAMGFEGDKVGQGLARLLLSSPAPDRRVVIDTFAKFRLSDKFIYNPRHVFDQDLRREVRDTERMLWELDAGGVRVKFTNPMGAFFLRAPVRNHKKLVIVDDRVAYIGGFNFTEHNFAWRDVMLRIEDPEIASFLAEDFLATWRGGNLGVVRAFPGITLYLFDGRRNVSLFSALFGLLEGANERIDVECAYLTPPFSGKLRKARERGVPVRLIMAAANNWPLVYDHVLWESARAGIELRLYEGRMVHMKTMLVDDRALVLGSANFDFWSYRFQQEVMGIVTDPEVVADFRRRVFEEDLRASRPCDLDVGPIKGRLANLRLRSIEKVWLFFNPAGDEGAHD